MSDRLTLHERLCELLGSTNVYFQPPEGFKLKYPCIIYEIDGSHNLNADDIAYINKRRYVITHIFKDVESDLIDEMLGRFSYCSYDRRFKSENLYHDVFRIYM